MSTFSRRARRAIPIAILLLLAACLLTIVGGRMVRAYQEVRNEQRVRQGEAIGVLPWMTIPYIARTYNVPEPDLYTALDLTPSRRNQKSPLQYIALREGHDLDADIATLNRLIDARGNKPIRLPGSPRPATPGASR